MDVHSQHLYRENLFPNADYNAKIRLLEERSQKIKDQRLILEGRSERRGTLAYHVLLSRTSHLRRKAILQKKEALAAQNRNLKLQADVESVVARAALHENTRVETNNRFMKTKATFLQKVCELYPDWQKTVEQQRKQRLIDLDLEIAASKQRRTAMQDMFQQDVALNNEVSAMESALLGAHEREKLDAFEIEQVKKRMMAEQEETKQAVMAAAADGSRRWLATEEPMLRAAHEERMKFVEENIANKLRSEFSTTAHGVMAMQGTEGLQRTADAAMSAIRRDDISAQPQVGHAIPSTKEAYHPSRNLLALETAVAGVDKNMTQTSDVSDEAAAQAASIDDIKKRMGMSADSLPAKHSPIGGKIVTAHGLQSKGIQPVAQPANEPASTVNDSFTERKEELARMADMVLDRKSPKPRKTVSLADWEREVAERKRRTATEMLVSGTGASATEPTKPAVETKAPVIKSETLSLTERWNQQKSDDKNKEIKTLEASKNVAASPKPAVRAYEIPGSTKDTAATPAVAATVEKERSPVPAKVHSHRIAALSPVSPGPALSPQPQQHKQQLQSPVVSAAAHARAQMEREQDAAMLQSTNTSSASSPSKTSLSKIPEKLVLVSDSSDEGVHQKEAPSKASPTPVFQKPARQRSRSGETHSPYKASQVPTNKALPDLQVSPSSPGQAVLSAPGRNRVTSLSSIEGSSNAYVPSPTRFLSAEEQVRLVKILMRHIESDPTDRNLYKLSENIPGHSEKQDLMRTALASKPISSFQRGKCAQVLLEAATNYPGGLVPSEFVDQMNIDPDGVHESDIVGYMKNRHRKLYWDAMVKHLTNMAKGSAVDLDSLVQTFSPAMLRSADLRTVPTQDEIKTFAEVLKRMVVAKMMGDSDDFSATTTSTSHKAPQTSTTGTVDSVSSFDKPPNPSASSVPRSMSAGKASSPYVQAQSPYTSMPSSTFGAAAKSPFGIPSNAYARSSASPSLGFSSRSPDALRQSLDSLSSGGKGGHTPSGSQIGAAGGVSAAILGQGKGHLNLTLDDSDSDIELDLEVAPMPIVKPASRDESDEFDY